jgi:regulator of protease activity HflC (stomatin/prohibitin superfamily)
MENTPTYLTYLVCFYGLFIILIIASLAASIRIVREDKRLSVYRLGRYLGEKGPGLVILIPFVDKGIPIESAGEGNAVRTDLVGATGETRTTVFTSGKVLLGEEEWEATSQSVISAGRRVRVVKIILEVEEDTEE